jgi:hypothetical protein
MRIIASIEKILTHFANPPQAQRSTARGDPRQRSPDATQIHREICRAAQPGKGGRVSGCPTVHIARKRAEGRGRISPLSCGAGHGFRTLAGEKRVRRPRSSRRELDDYLASVRSRQHPIHHWGSLSPGIEPSLHLLEAASCDQPPSACIASIARGPKSRTKNLRSARAWRGVPPDSDTGIAEHRAARAGDYQFCQVPLVLPVPRRQWRC